MLQVIHKNRFKTTPANRKMSFDTLALKSSGIVDPAEQQAYVIPKLKDKSWCFHRGFQPFIFQHVTKKRFNMAALHEIITSLIYTYFL